jgi:outer membrane protein OmpA-like peptidoglycan-associated protein
MRFLCIKNIAKFFSVGGVAVALAACAQQPKQPVVPPQLTHAQKLQIAIKNLRNDDVQIARVGDTVRLVIPSNNLFYIDSEHMRAGSKFVLHDLKAYINLQQVVLAEVATFAPSYPATSSQQKLAIRRSQVLMNQLDDVGVDVRLLAAEGDLRVSRKSALIFSPNSYNNMTIIYFTVNQNNWIN